MIPATVSEDPLAHCGDGGTVHVFSEFDPEAERNACPSCGLEFVPDASWRQGWRPDAPAAKEK